MPEKPLTIATYAAGASLAAITLVYVFSPTFFHESESSSTRKKGVVGLANPANDCFINSVLQALAGLDDLRKYLIRETHRRKLDGPEVYHVDRESAVAEGKKVPPWKLEGLRQGLVTQALKEVLDRLNERPIFRKTISAQGFITVLEHAFRTRISREQQDAQEFLQVVMERLCEEYHAGQKARRRPQSISLKIPNGDHGAESAEKGLGLLALHEDERQDPDGDGEQKSGTAESEKEEDSGTENNAEEEDGFPLEGKMESQIECLTCHFKPKPTISTFVTLTLNVPQHSSTTLNACFDGVLKIEYIDDFKCEYCRLAHAISVYESDLARAPPASPAHARLTTDLSALRAALATDPEKPPSSVPLPSLSRAPLRRIARHMRISRFPKVLAVHLSRSIFSATTLSSKNMAKVSFPESLALGPLLAQRRYRLLGLVTHKGGHNSGHYESFRRQVLGAEPYSTPASFGTKGGAYSRGSSPNPSAVQSPRIEEQRGPPLTPAAAAVAGGDSGADLPGPALAPSMPPSPSPSTLQPPPSRSSLGSTRPSTQRSSAPAPPPAGGESSSSSGGGSGGSGGSGRFPVRRRGKKDNRWWRISDERIRECRTGDALGMQREVYLLFYELCRPVGE